MVRRLNTLNTALAVSALAEPWCLPAQLLYAVDIRPFAPSGNAQPQVALAKVQGVMQHNQARVRVRNFPAEM